jgi:hypothetical protein
MSGEPEVSAERHPDDAAEASLRPQTLADFTAQKPAARIWRSSSPPPKHAARDLTQL